MLSILVITAVENLQVTRRENDIINILIFNTTLNQKVWEKIFHIRKSYNSAFKNYFLEEKSFKRNLYKF